MRHTPLENKITKMAQPVTEDLGLELVCVKIIGEGGSQNVQVMAEDPQTRRLTIDKCASLSRALSAVFDVEDPINGTYRLEISSPGIDRPLVKTEDFETYKGFKAKLETETPTKEGRKRFNGMLRGIEEGIITIDTDQGRSQVPFDDLAKAKLVLTDELINATSNDRSKN